MTTALSVAVFAHNEEERIKGSLEALCAAGLSNEDTVHVLVNGSSDGTEALVRHLAEGDRRIVPHVITFGDKSNAWNTYVYRIANTAAHHVFMDGDVRPSPGTLTAMQATLAANGQARAVSSLPEGGRQSAAWSQQILKNHGLPGNLYLLPAHTLTRLRTLQFHMPVGLVGDDTFLRWALVRDFDPNGPVDPNRIAPCQAARFRYQSFPIASTKGLQALLKRHRRYARRDLEMQLLTSHLIEHGIQAIPPYITDLYGKARPWTALKGRLRLRSVLAFDAYNFARARRGRRPADDPFHAVFENSP